MNALHKALRPTKRRLRLLRAMDGLQWGLLLGAACCVLVMIISFFVPLMHRTYYLLCTLVLPVVGTLIGAALHLGSYRAACAADKAGLKERAQTALTLQNGSAMTECLMEDAIRNLEALEIKAAFPFAADKKRMLALLCTCALCGALFLIKNPQDQVLKTQAQFQQEAQKLAQEAQKALDKAAEALTPEELTELRKLMGDLARELAQSRDSRDALMALDQAEKALERLTNAQQALQSAAEALQNAGMDAAAQAMEAGDAQQLSEALSNESAAQAAAEALDAAASATSGQASQALSAAASMLRAGNASGAVSTLQNAASLGNMQALLSSMRSALGSGQGLGQGLGSGQGKGSGNGQGQGIGQSEGDGGGGGAGKGTTSQDAGYTPGSDRQRQSGTGQAEYREVPYESIYDPTWLSAGGEMVNETGAVGEGESTRINLAPGLGDATNTVPYNEVIAQYAQTAAKAAQNPDLPAYKQQWINDYFAALTSQND